MRKTTPFPDAANPTLSETPSFADAADSPLSETNSFPDAANPTLSETSPFADAADSILSETSPFPDGQDVASASEATGLIPAMPEDDEQAQSYESLYPIHEQKDTPSPNRNGAGKPPFTKTPGRA